LLRRSGGLLYCRGLASTGPGGERRGGRREKGGRKKIPPENDTVLRSGGGRRAAVGRQVHVMPHYLVCARNVPRRHTPQSAICRTSPPSLGTLMKTRTHTHKRHIHTHTHPHTHTTPQSHLLVDSRALLNVNLPLRLILLTRLNLCRAPCLAPCLAPCGAPRRMANTQLGIGKPVFPRHCHIHPRIVGQRLQPRLAGVCGAEFGGPACVLRRQLGARCCHLGGCRHDALGQRQHALRNQRQALYPPRALERVGVNLPVLVAGRLLLGVLGGALRARVIPSVPLLRV